MRAIGEEDFKRKIKKARMICCPEAGYFCGFEKPNPYAEKEFVFEESCKGFSSSHRFGELLIVRSGEGSIRLAAFIFEGEPE